MRTSLSTDEMASYVSNQVNYFYPDGQSINIGTHKSDLKLALDRLENCFKHSSVKWYCASGEAIFNHLFSDQYAAFLWFLSNTLWHAEADEWLLNKLFYLNKALHGIECMYDTKLPDVFFLSHTVGTVLGKATYGNFLVVSHGCTIGIHRGNYPIIGQAVALGAGASLIGKCSVGNRVSIGSHPSLFEKDISNDTTVYQDEHGQIIHRHPTSPYAQKFYATDLSQI